ncbi:MAG: ECF transporter S component [Clostridia bacterium]|nr:ECF transporter S component [Clostridia bacterium]MBO5207580.1 ECF transporter S component [Clostridia bacterium]MBP3583071.1 ECF transporter S component [Clostridia bacterium]
MRRETLIKLTGTALLLAVGYLLPLLTGQIPEIGNLLLPMHIPVLLCGALFGGIWGGALGFVLPLTRSLIFSKPLIFPTAIAMAFELMSYGLVIGICFSVMKPRRFAAYYLPLLSAMLVGRAVWGAVMAVLLGVFGDGFGFSLFIGGAFLEAIPGIILQLILVPTLISVLIKSGAYVPCWHKKSLK